jgi:hypothetical protein
LLPHFTSSSKFNEQIAFFVDNFGYSFPDFLPEAIPPRLQLKRGDEQLQGNI